MEIRRAYKNSSQSYSYLIRSDKRLSNEKYQRLHDILEKYKGRRITIKILLDCITTSLDGFPNFLHIIFEENDAEKTTLTFENGLLTQYKAKVFFTKDRILLFTCDKEGKIKVYGSNIDPNNATSNTVDLVNYFYDNQIEMLTYLTHFDQRRINPQKN